MDEKIILSDVKQKFATAREKCPGMSDDVYALTDYISVVASDKLTPLGLSMCLDLISYDLQKCKNGFTKLPKNLVDRRAQVLIQMAYIPQVVDAIADEKFALEFRKICSDTLGFNSPKRVDALVDLQCPENVRAAVDWWANVIQSPKFDNGSDTFSFAGTMLTGNLSDYSEEQIKAFKGSLAQDILNELKNNGSCYLSVDYTPCDILSNAGKKIGLDDHLSYPWKTRMNITENVVEVSYNSQKEVIWSKEKEQNMEENQESNHMHR